MSQTNYGPIVTNLLCTVAGAAFSEYSEGGTPRMHRSICEISPELFFPLNLEINLDKLEAVAVEVGEWISAYVSLEETNGVIWPGDLADAVAAVNEQTGTPLCPPIVELLRGVAAQLGEKPLASDAAEEAVA